jgi:divalent metal cation (Fe/Co/Zn/Cd) transporter
MGARRRRTDRLRWETRSPHACAPGGRRLESAALIADGNHARVDAFVSLGVVLSALVVGLGVEIADPLIGLAITLVILKITWDSWRTVHPSAED